MSDTKNIPDLNAVESSNISHIGYEPSAQNLFVRFKSGGLYKYHDVPPVAHDAFMEAESKGKHFSKNFAGKFKHEKIE